MDYDLYCLRIFTQVVKDGSFSSAARSLKITQPTVSQKIAGLEHDLGHKLFERVGHEIHLTATGKELSHFANEILEKADRFTDAVKNNQASIKGLVKYAMPESCQWTPHYRRIMAQIREFPEIRFEIDILPNDLIVQGLLQGRYDFGFVVGERLNPELRFEKFSDEHYSAVASDKKLLKPFSELNVDTLRLISYPGWELFFTTWAKSAGTWEKLKNRLQTPTVKIGTLSGAIHATQEGAGVSIIPTHCVMEELSSKKLFEHPIHKNGSNPVHIVKRTGEKLPQRVDLVLNLLRKAKKELG